MSNVAKTTTERGFRIAPLLNDEWAVLSNRNLIKTKMVVDRVQDLEDNEHLAAAFPEEYSHSYLVNFKAVEARNIERILSAFNMDVEGEMIPNDEYDANDPESEKMIEDTSHHLSIIPWEEAKGMQFSHKVNVFVDRKTGEVVDNRPERGEIVTVNPGLIFTKDGAPVYGKFDVDGELITDETPEEKKEQCIEVVSMTIPKAVKATGFMTHLNRAKRNVEVVTPANGRAQVGTSAPVETPVEVEA